MATPNRGDKTVNEFIKRLEEIKARASVIQKFSPDEITEDVKAELRALRSERSDLESKIEDAQILEELQADAPEVKAEEPAKEEEPAVEEPAKEEEAPVEEPAKEEAPAEAPAEAIAASIGGSPVDAPKEKGAANAGLTIVASSGFGLNGGKRLDLPGWNKVIRAAFGSGEGKHTFATIDRSSGRAAVSARNSAIENSLIMSRNSEGETLPLTAAACYCGPFETMKEINTLGLDDRPIAGMFRSVDVNGPFKYIRDLNLADVATGVQIWECADQAAVVAATPATWKPCVTLDCQADHQVDPYAIPACGLFSTFQQISHPELIDDFIKKLGIQYARTAEQKLLDTLRADSTVLTYGVTGMGILNTLEGILGHIASFSGYVRRMNWSDYALVVPPGFIEALTTDEHRRGFSRGANRNDVLAQLRELGVGQIVEARDADSTAEVDYTNAHTLYHAPGTTVAFNPCNSVAKWTLNVVPVNAYTRGESTMVEAGFQRDADLTRQNMVQFFMEGQEFLEKMAVDVPSYTIELSGAGTGGTSALVTPEAC